MNTENAIVGDHEKIKELAKERKCSVKDLLALSPNRDPFYAGGKSSREKAEWFATIWKQEGFKKGAHLRRVHYRLVSKEGSTKPDGTPYENDQKSWDYLLAAACQARYLGLVSPDLLVDMRNPGPIVNALPIDYREANWTCDEFFWFLPHVSASLSDGEDWRMPHIYPCGYWYEPNLQPYLLEVWVEKTTMNDIFGPLCSKYHANLVTGAGFLSITSVMGLLKRIEDTGKPCRIFYVSDFDPAGSFMPFAISRQIEYWKNYYSIDHDIKLKQVALTREQVEKYKLPSIPIKESDGRKESFKKAYGQDATELDALEANHKGELERLVQEEFLRYFDIDLENSFREAEDTAIDIIQKWEEEHLAQYEEELQKLNEIKRPIVQKYEERLQKIQEECAAEFRVFREYLEKLRCTIINEIDRAKRDGDIYLPLVPDPEVEGDTEDDLWIYDSSRDYLGQLRVYKALMPNGREVEQA